MSKKLSLFRARRDREEARLVPKTFKLEPTIAKAFSEQAHIEGVQQIFMLEKMICYYIQTNGHKAIVD